MGQNGRRSHRGLYAVKDVIFWHFWGPNFCLNLNSYLASIFLCSMLEHLLETIGNSLETDCHQLSPDRPHGTAGRRFLQFCAKLQTVGWSLCSVSRGEISSSISIWLRSGAHYISLLALFLNDKNHTYNGVFSIFSTFFHYVSRTVLLYVCWHSMTN
jgi:hypothetical protein